MRKIAFRLTLLFLLTAQAVAAPAPMQTRNFSLLKSAFCNAKYRCVAAGIVRELGVDKTMDIIVEHYQVFPRKPSPKHLFIPGYNVRIEKEGSKISTATINHPRAQDYVEDGTFTMDFFGFMAGIDLSSLVGKADTQCEILFKTPSSAYAILPTAVAYMWAGREFRVMEEVGLESPTIQNMPKKDKFSYMTPDECSKELYGP